MKLYFNIILSQGIDINADRNRFKNVISASVPDSLHFMYCAEDDDYDDDETSASGSSDCDDDDDLPVGLGRRTNQENNVHHGKPSAHRDHYLPSVGLLFRRLTTCTGCTHDVCSTHLLPSLCTLSGTFTQVNNPMATRYRVSLLESPNVNENEHLVS